MGNKKYDVYNERGQRIGEAREKPDFDVEALGPIVVIVGVLLFGIILIPVWILIKMASATKEAPKLMIPIWLILVAAFVGLFIRENQRLRLAAQGSSSSIRTPVSTENIKIQLPATLRIGPKTGIYIMKGDHIHIKYNYGTWAYAPEAGLSKPDDSSSVDINAWMPDKPLGSIVGRIGTGKVFYVGQELDMPSAAEEGELSLFMNDGTNKYKDNRGSINVEIKVDHYEKVPEHLKLSVQSTAITSANGATTQTSAPSQEKPLEIKGVVNADSLNVRSGPGADQKSIGKLSKNSEVTVLGRNEAGNWLQISFKNTTGWVSAKFVTTQVSSTEIPLVPTSP